MLFARVVEGLEGLRTTLIASCQVFQGFTRAKMCVLYHWIMDAAPKSPRPYSMAGNTRPKIPKPLRRQAGTH